LDSSFSSGARPLLLDSSSILLLSWGSQRPSLHRHTLQVSTLEPVSPRKRDASCPSTKACHCLGVFRPCRSSRLRRFSPPGRCRLVASCSRSWDSPRFGWVGSHRPCCSVPSWLGWHSSSMRSRVIVGLCVMCHLRPRANSVPLMGWSTVRSKPVHLMHLTLATSSPAAPVRGPWAVGYGSPTLAAEATLAGSWVAPTTRVCSSCAHAEALCMSRFARVARNDPSLLASEPTSPDP
jgi:hypothetical protein